MSTAPNPNYALASFKQEGSYSYDTLLADGHDVTSRKGTIASGGGFVYRGSIRHIDPATGVITAAVTGAAATVANCVVAENCDATSATKECLVYLTGRMKADAVIWPAAGSHAAHTEDLRDVGIYLESVLYRDGMIVKSTPSEEDAAKAKERVEAARKRLKEGEKAAAAEEPGKIADSSWAYLTEEERLNNPELAAPEPYDPEKEKEKERQKEKEGQKESPKPTPPPTPPKR